ncbi:IS66 family insertion sequence element accessory protein TnpA [Sphingobacterium sp. SYP-B4668]|uniref:IS66 family insertion sequence element accessory protein TnpA n=1 Tax=Sphingobacterium sp. SYP-B4668 TaxID=2996035 RepID=UPI0022DE65A2|nr:transposase [Sphingobacterium sp. SYP-B4668]
MRKSKFSESQIIKILSLQESGQSVSDICRENGISQGTFYSWRSKYSGMEASQLKQLKDNLPTVTWLNRLLATSSVTSSGEQASCS